MFLSTNNETITKARRRPSASPHTQNQHCEDCLMVDQETRGFIGKAMRVFVGKGSEITHKESVLASFCSSGVSDVS